MGLESYFSAPFLMSFITAANVCAAIGGVLYIASTSMRTVITPRIAGIASAPLSVLGDFRALLPADLPLFPPASA